MSRPKERAAPLRDEMKREFIERHVPGRVRLLEQALEKMKVCRGFYYHFTVAAIASRCLAQFLGLKLSRAGALVQDKHYFPHEGNASYEVKITDVCSAKLLEPSSFSPADQQVLKDGFHIINREVAHFTCWETPPRHRVNDDPIATYHRLVGTLDRFARIILREVRRAL